MSIGDTITDPIPPVSTAGTGYASQLVAFLTEVKARLEAKVPLTSLLIGALDMANNALTNVASVGLYESALEPSTPVGSLQRFNNDLWYVSDAGAFALTSGASLDVSSVAGIGGDYGSPNPAMLKFVDADKTYYFYDDEPAGEWGYIRARYVEVAGGLTSANRVRIDWTAGTSYTLSLPAAVPGAGARTMLSLDENGDILQTGNITTSVTATHFYNTAEETIVYSVRNNGLNTTTGSLGAGAGSITSSDNYEFSLPSLPVGSVITSWSVAGTKTTSNANTMTTQMYKKAFNGSTTALGSAQTNSQNAPGTITPMGEASVTFTLSTDEYFLFTFSSSAFAGGGVEHLSDLKITITHPA